ncbi:MAG: ATP-dependent RecD-like DNA helicase [Erysipelotrichaceae bacterium]|nr:ATP-dependent RecD-like DNA helicase [Erysipelotrichaceae bacterium]
MSDSIVCRFVSMIFHSDATSFSVGRFQLYEVEERQMIVTGYYHILEADTLYRCTGEYVEHPKYGMQFKAERIERVLASDEDSLVRFLSGPLFPGIGKKFAQTMVNVLGTDLLDQIRQNENVLELVPKMTEKKKKSILQGIAASENQLEKTISFLSSHGLGIRNIMRLDRVYGEKALELITENPYRMIDEVDGIGFATADKLAMSLGFSHENPVRIEACLVSLVMEMCMSTGDTYVSYEKIKPALEKKLGFEIEDFDEILFSALSRGLLEHEEGRIYHHSQMNAEKAIALFSSTFPLVPLEPYDTKKYMEELSLFQDSISIHYDQKQIEAIDSFFDHDLTILTGGPGTGKTTVVRGMVNLFRELYPDRMIACCAPTGRAAKRLAELTKVECQTIHSLLKWDLETNTFGMNEESPLSVDCLIIDEFSMVDAYLFAALCKASSQIKKIVIIGDEDQLPSVGPGCVLKDLIESNLYPVTRLKTIFRQKEGSDVISLAHAIQKRDIEHLKYTGDVAFFECSQYDIKSLVLQIVQSALEKGYHLSDIQLLACKYSGVAGIDRLNAALQECFNPHDPLLKEWKVGHRIFRENDKILQLKNQIDDGVYNGDIGLLTEVIDPDEDFNHQARLIVDFDGIFAEYTSESFQNITHAYCISVHKSQGSEYPIVILPIVPEATFMLQRRLIYTAVSRAKKSLILLGSKELFEKAVLKEEKTLRHTTLKERMNKIQSERIFALE